MLYPSNFIGIDIANKNNFLCDAGMRALSKFIFQILQYTIRIIKAIIKWFFSVSIKSETLEEFLLHGSTCWRPFWNSFLRSVDCLYLWGCSYKKSKLNLREYLEPEFREEIASQHQEHLRKHNFYAQYKITSFELSYRSILSISRLTLDNIIRGVR